MTATWERVLTAIEARVPEATFNRWFRPLNAKENSNGAFHLVTDDEFDAVFLEKNFAELIRLHLERILGDSVDLRITHEPPGDGATVPSDAASSGPGAGIPSREPPHTPQPLAQPSPSGRPATPAAAGVAAGGHSHAFSGSRPRLSPMEGPSVTERMIEAGLRLQYSFDEFVVGNSNEFAHAACLAVQERPGRVYNPLFLYGAVGLGKTHLLNAIGIELLRSRPQARVRYMTSETFMNQLIEAMRLQQMAEFRARIRDGLDALLIDDIQFIAGKDSTQREFFHTFNALHQSGTQIVITSDRYPLEIPHLEERLRSRFQWGLVADIQAPSIETRLAILKQKALGLDLDIPDEAALFLAENVRSNVRELEGALLRIHAYVAFNRRSVTLGLVKSLLRQFIQESNRQITADAVQKAVCNYYNVKLADLRGKGRARAISQPRQVAMYLAKSLTGLSYPQLGEKFGGRDHTTILSGVRKIRGLIETDKGLAAVIQHLEKELTRQ